MSRLTELIKYHEQHIEDLAKSYGIATEHMEMGEVKEYAGHCQRQEETLTYLKELQHYKDLEEQGRLKVQVHGQWEILTDEYDCEYMLCTACGGEFYSVDDDTVDSTYNYCPNCGVKMR